MKYSEPVIKATLRNTVLKRQLRIHDDGLVSCNRLNVVFVSATLPCTGRITALHTCLLQHTSFKHKTLLRCNEFCLVCFCVVSPRITSDELWLSSVRVDDRGVALKLWAVQNQTTKCQFLHNVALSTNATQYKY